MRDTEHMKNHLFVVTRVNGELICRQPIEDPFLTCRTIHVKEWSFWDWLKLIFKRRYEVHLLVKVESDGVSQRRWFLGPDICEKCKHERIELPHYKRDGMSVCRDCYDGIEREPVANGISNFVE